MKKKVVLAAILVVLNLFLGAWIDRTWFRSPGSGPTHTLVPEQPLPWPEPAAQPAFWPSARPLDV